MSSIAKLLPAPIADSAAADTVLELAFLTSAVDGHLADEELDAFRELVGLARGIPATKDDVDTLLERFVVAAHSVGVDARVREVATAVRPDLRETAFRIAAGLSLVDRDQSEHEDELLTILSQAMSIGERTDALVREARTLVADDRA